MGEGRIASVSRPLANSQYPTYTTNWQYIFPHTSISADGDIHIDMAVDSAGSGSSGNNTGESPIISEVINATSTQPQLSRFAYNSPGDLSRHLSFLY